MTAEERIAYAKEKDLTQLDLSDCELTSIPDSVYELAQLKTLILGRNYHPNEDQSKRNRILFIPMSITLLRNLEGIGLAYNNLEEFPSYLLQLPRLRTLMLNYNRLTDIPPEIGQLKQLRVLGLEGNRIENLPAEIGLLRQLQILGAANNQISSLPPAFIGLQQLQQLGLANNEFTAIPSEVFELKLLQALGLANNEITAFPAGLTKLSRLKKLDLSGNPIDQRFIDLAARGHRAISSWIIDQQKRKERLLNSIIRGKKDAQERKNIRQRLTSLLKSNKLVCEVCNGNKRLSGYDVHLKTHFNGEVCYGCEGKGVPDEVNEGLHDVIEIANKHKEQYREQIIRQAKEVQAFQSRMQGQNYNQNILYQETRDNLQKILNEKQQRLDKLLNRFSIYEGFERKIHITLYNYHILQLTRKEQGTDLSFDSIDDYSVLYATSQMAEVIVTEVEQVFQSLDTAMSEGETTELKEKLTALLKEFEDLGKPKP